VLADAWCLLARRGWEFALPTFPGLSRHVSELISHFDEIMMDPKILLSFVCLAASRGVTCEGFALLVHNDFRGLGSRRLGNQRQDQQVVCH
jgi:hypothetical protein